MKIIPKSISNKFVIKIVALYTLLIIILMIIIISIILTFFNYNLQTSYEENQTYIVNQVKEKLYINYTSIQNIIYSLYNINFINLINDLSTPDEAHEAQSALSKISFQNSQVYEIIIYSNTGNTVYSEKNNFSNNRSVDINYDFKNNLIDPHPELFLHTPTSKINETLPYILNNTTESLSITGTLSNITLNERPLKPLAYYIININPNSFLAIDDYSKMNQMGNILLYDEGNHILFNNSPFKDSVINEIVNTDQKLILVDQKYHIKKSVISNSGWTIVHFYSQEEFNENFRLLYKIIASVTIIALGILVFIIFLLSNHFSKRINQLMDAIFQVSNGNLMVNYVDESPDEIGKLSITFKEMCQNLNYHIQKEYVLELENKAAKISILQSTINPHFLYNTLDAIRSKTLLNGDVETSDMIAILGNLFRSIVNNDSNSILIESELDYVINYFTLLNIRYDNQIIINYDIDDTLLKYHIPKFTLQPIIENSIVHGLFDTEDFVISIEGSLINNNILICVIDNGIGITDSKLKSLNQFINDKSISKKNKSLGLHNVNQRIKLIHGDDYGLTLKSDKTSGTIVEILLPCKHNLGGQNV